MQMPCLALVNTRRALDALQPSVVSYERVLISESQDRSEAADVLLAFFSFKYALIL
jgi:hypothetical protein